MPITKISFTFGRTQSLPDYCNVRPSVTLEYTFDSGDHLQNVMTMLIDKAHSIVEEECDQALERAGMPAEFSTLPRYSVLAFGDALTLNKARKGSNPKYAHLDQVIAYGELELSIDELQATTNTAKPGRRKAQPVQLELQPAKPSRRGRSK